MQHISGISRHQLQIISLEDKITFENSVRFVEAVVENILPQKLGILVITKQIHSKKKRTLNPLDPDASGLPNYLSITP